MTAHIPGSNSACDWVRISALKVPIRIGCEASEREHYQQIEVDLAIALDSSRAAESGMLEHTVCYLTVAMRVLELSRSQSWALLEQFADACAKTILEHFPAAQGVCCTLRKFVIPAAHSVGLEIWRVRDSQSP